MLLDKKLEGLRAQLDPVFAEDTAYPGSWNPLIPAQGHCAVVALVVQRIYGGYLASTLAKHPGSEDTISHWFNVQISDPADEGAWVDADLTGDQFGLAKVRVGKDRSVWPKYTIRQATGVSEETWQRFELFWSRLAAAGVVEEAALDEVPWQGT